MPINSPKTVYIAANNFEAANVMMIIQDAGIEAFVLEDICQTEFGYSPMVHQPKVVVETQNEAQALEIVSAYQQKVRRRNEVETLFKEGHAFPREACLDIICEYCQKTVYFPQELEGTIQSCPECRCHIDVEVFPDDESYS